MNKWKRYELKDRAKQVLKVNYWVAFVVALIFVAISGGLNLSNTGWRSSINFNNRWDSNLWYMQSESKFDFDSFGEFLEEFPEYFQDELESQGEISGFAVRSFVRNVLPFMIGLIIAGSVIAGLVGLALKIFAINPLKMGCKTFYKTSAEEPHNNMRYLGTAFKGGNYGSVIKTMFFRDLYIFLWGLLFIIPGIIKRYAYRMVPYILADNPKMDANEAITLSRTMMRGQKWRAFVLDLSFLGWYILGVLALGIGVLFVHPYYYSTDAQLYLALRVKAIDDGTANQEAFGLLDAGEDA